MANLYVTVTEEITLPNNTTEKTYVFKNITGINQIVRRVDTITTNFSGSGIEILKFVDSEAQQVGSGFVKQDTKYVRITNLSQTYSAVIYLVVTNQESTLFNLDPGKTLMFNDADINASSTIDYVAESYVDEMYYSSFAYIDSIKAKAIGGNVQLEYFVASL
jgi:hypothetical protein